MRPEYRRTPTMPHDNDVLDPQRLHGKLKRRRCRMVLPVRLIGRHHVRDMRTTKSSPGMESKITSGAALESQQGNHQRVRLLPLLGENPITITLVLVAATHDVAVAVEECGRKTGHCYRLQRVTSRCNTGNKVCLSDQSERTGLRCADA